MVSSRKETPGVQRSRHVIRTGLGSVRKPSAFDKRETKEAPPDVGVAKEIRMLRLCPHTRRRTRICFGRPARNRGNCESALISNVSSIA